MTVVLLSVLTKQVFAVVVAVGSADDCMHMLPDRRAVGELTPQAHGVLVIKFNENDGAMDAVVEDGVVVGGAFPGKVGLVPVVQNFVHAYVRMFVTHLAYEQSD